MPVRTDEFVAIAQRGQQATADAVRSWTELARNYAEHVTPDRPLPRPAEVKAAVDTWYDLAGRLLAEQKAFARTVIDAGTEAADVVTEQARAGRFPV